jgi:hypothetical protein
VNKCEFGNDLFLILIFVTIADSLRRIYGVLEWGHSWWPTS